jgi:hypothetical protein
MNMDIPTIMIIKFAGKMALFNINLRSTNGYFARLSVTMNSTKEIIPVTKNDTTCIDKSDELLIVLLPALPVSI